MMSNTKSPQTMSYRICYTDNEHHLNGVITLIDFEDKTGIAVVYVGEIPAGHNKPVWHASVEMIVSTGRDEWQTKTPHMRRNETGEEVEQDWTFKKVQERQDCPFDAVNCYENDIKYKSYISYSLESRCPDGSVCTLQEDGTGTGGNSGE